jgi:hypothetical protein
VIGVKVSIMLPEEPALAAKEKEEVTEVGEATG